MPSVTVIKSVGIIIISFIIGISFFYFTTSLSTEKKKQQLEDVLSLIINFVIYIWVGKILLNLSLFISDPLAVLAYPSNASSFYVATLLLIINIGYRVWRHEFNIVRWLNVFLPVILAAAFSYEFLQLLDSGHQQITQLIFYMLLLIAYLLLENKFPINKVTLYIMSIWAIGQLISSLIFPLVTLFGYSMKPWFNLILSIMIIGFTVYNQRKQV